MDSSTIKDCIEMCRDRLFKHFRETSTSNIKISMESDPNGFRLVHNLDSDLVRDIGRYDFDDNPLLSISIEIPHLIKTHGIKARTKDGSYVSATLEMAYQEPSDTSKTGMIETEMSQLLAAHAGTLREHIGTLTHAHLKGLMGTEPQFEYLKQDSPGPLVLYRLIINSVSNNLNERPVPPKPIVSQESPAINAITSESQKYSTEAVSEPIISRSDSNSIKSFNEVFTEEFNKQYPRSLVTETIVAVLGGIPFALARSVLRYLTVRKLSGEQSGPEPEINGQVYKQYQTTMGVGTLIMGLLAFAALLRGAITFEDFLYYSNGQFTNRVPLLYVILLCGAPYAFMINKIIRHHDNSLYPRSVRRMFA